MRDPFPSQRSKSGPWALWRSSLSPAKAVCLASGLRPISGPRQHQARPGTPSTKPSTPSATRSASTSYFRPDASSHSIRIWYGSICGNSSNRFATAIGKRLPQSTKARCSTDSTSARAESSSRGSTPSGAECFGNTRERSRTWPYKRRRLAITRAASAGGGSLRTPTHSPLASRRS